MAFHEVRLPAAIALGARGGPERRTEIVTLGSGHEHRNQLWAHSRRRWNLGYGIKSRPDLDTLIAFFEARRGRMHGFRFHDRLDGGSAPGEAAPGPADQTIGTGDGSRTVFQLTKTYGTGPTAYVRPITKPVAGSVRLAVAGVEAPLGAGFTVDLATGQVTLAAPPANGAPVTAGFAFDVPVRFDTDVLEIDAAAFDAGQIPDVPILEIRP